MLTVKWGKEVHTVATTTTMTVAQFRLELERVTGVPVPRQKLLGLPKKAAEDALLCDLKLKATKKLMLMGKKRPRNQLSDAERKAL